jgi:hypothetical protein
MYQHTQKMRLEKDYPYTLSSWRNPIQHPSHVPAKPVPTDTYLWIKVSLSRKDYVKNTSNGRRWRWEISGAQAQGRRVVIRA